MSTAKRGGLPADEPGWSYLVGDFVAYLAAIGRPATTIGVRRGQLEQLERGLGVRPAAVAMGGGSVGRTQLCRILQSPPVVSRRLDVKPVSYSTFSALTQCGKSATAQQH
jgi:hypothetical protein